MNLVRSTGHPSFLNQPMNSAFLIGLMASLAFIKLFPLGQADPTRNGQRCDFLKVAKVDCSKSTDNNHSNGYLNYPFAEHD